MMTNKEAINVLRAMKDECILVFDKDRKDALDKAIFALERMQEDEG